MTKTVYLFFLLALFFLLSALFAPQVHADRVYLDITPSDVRKIVIAIPAFQDQNTGAADLTMGKSMAELLGKALEFHGFVRVVNARNYGTISDVNWKEYGVDYVVRGELNRNGKTLVIEGRLQDVAEDKMLAGRRYKGMAGQQDDMVLRLADALVEEFTGEPGISRTSIAYVSDETGAKEIFLGDVMNRGRRQITRHKHLCVSPRFSPDGRSLAYTTYHHGNQDLYITDLQQSKITHSLSRQKGMNLAPGFSPDNQTMVVTLSKDGSPDLYLMDRKGKIIERLTARMGINVSPSFSPDGKSMVFVSDRSGQPQLYVMNLKNRNVQRLTFQGKENSEPSWSPKGDKIVYTGRVGERYHIFTIDSKGGQPTQLTSEWGDYESPTWSPDGKQLVLARRRNGHSEICTMFADGKGMRVLFALKGNQSYPRWSNRPR
jgi:TolB protein